MATKAKSAKGTKLGFREVGSSEPYTYFQEVKSVPPIGESPVKMDVTSLDSDFHEYIKDIPDFSADLVFTMNAQPYVTNGASDASNLNIIEDMDKNGEYEFIVQYPSINQQVTIIGDWSFEMGAGAVSQALEINFTIIPRSAPVFNDYGVNSYTLSFDPESDSGSGTGVMESQTVSVGTKIRTPASTFTAPEGKIFGSWNTEADGTGNSYNTNDSITMDRNYTLYAIWVTDNSE